MANVKFKRLLSSELASEAIEDGKTIWIKDGNNELYLDVGTVRKKMIPSDTALSTTSTNPIQNQALTNSIINTLSGAIAVTVDSIPCGTKPVKELNTIVSNNQTNRDTITLLATANSSTWTSFTVSNLNNYKKIGFDFCNADTNGTVHYTEVPVALFKTKNTQSKAIGFEYNAQVYGNSRYVDDTHIEATVSSTYYKIYIYGIK